MGANMEIICLFLYKASRNVHICMFTSLIILILVGAQVNVNQLQYINILKNLNKALPRTLQLGKYPSMNKLLYINVTK